MKARITMGTEYGKVGFITNCVEENGELYYYLRIKGSRGLAMYHESAIELIERTEATK